MASIKERLDAIYGTREALDKVRAEKAQKQAEREEEKAKKRAEKEEKEATAAEGKKKKKQPQADEDENSNKDSAPESTDAPPTPEPPEPDKPEVPDSDTAAEDEFDETDEDAATYTTSINDQPGVESELDKSETEPEDTPEPDPEPESKPDEPEPGPKPADKAADNPNESDDDDDPFSAKRSSAFTPPEDPLLDGEEMPFTAKNAKKDASATSGNTAEDEDVPDVYDQLKILFSISEKDEQGETRIKLTRFANIVTMHKGADIDYMKSIPHDLYLIDARTNKPIPATDAGFSENFRANFLVWFWRNVNARINNARMQGKKPYAEFIRDKKKPKTQPIQTDPQTSKPQSENTRKAEQPQQPQPPEPKQADLPELPAKSAPPATPSATPSGQPTPPAAFRRSAAPYRSARPRR